MKNLVIRHARWIGWILLGTYIFLIAAGLILQSISGMTAAGLGTPVPPVPILLISWSVVGVLLVSRQPRQPIGWVFLIMPILFGLNDFASGYAYYGWIAHPGSLPFVEGAIVYTYWSGRTLAATCLTFLFLLFPTGRPMSRRWGYLAWISIAATFTYILSAAVSPNPANRDPFPTDLLSPGSTTQSFILPLTLLSFFCVLVCVVLAISSLYLRLHRAVGVERQQLKWFAYASIFFIPSIFLILIGSFQELQWVFFLGVFMGGVMIVGIPAASAIAILRYRLWDIDILIRRTLIYGILTGVLALLYYGLVTLFQNLVSTFSGQDSPVVIVISTLFIAALFNPLRRQIQEIIDRRFYRQKYDAEEILAQFSATAQEEVDLIPLSNELLRVVNRTLQPEQVTLWLREP